MYADLVLALGFDSYVGTRVSGQPAQTSSLREDVELLRGPGLIRRF